LRGQFSAIAPQASIRYPLSNSECAKNSRRPVHKGTALQELPCRINVNAGCSSSGPRSRLQSLLHD